MTWPPEWSATDRQRCPECGERCRQREWHRELDTQIVAVLDYQCTECGWEERHYIG